MKTSSRGLAMIASFEGLVPAPYLDGTGVWTWGVGHTAAAGPPDPAKMPRGMPDDLDAAIANALAQFCADIRKYEAAVSRAVRVPLAQHEFDAVVSWHYNTGAVATATLTKMLNAGNKAAAAVELSKWTRAGGRINEGLEDRRADERRLFEDGVYPGGTIPVWRVDKSGRVNFRAAIRRLPMSIFDDAPPPAPTGAGFWAALIARIVNWLKGLRP